MYNREFEFKDLNGRPRKARLYFHLMETDVFKLLVEFKTIMDWRASLAKDEGIRELDPVEVVTFYTAFEEILLSAHGTPSDDAMAFKRGSRYDFAESVAFNAAMVFYVSNPDETGKLIEALLPEGLAAMVESQDENLREAAEKAKDVDSRAEIERLRAQLAEVRGETAGAIER